MLAEYRNGKLTPVGRVGSGLSGALRNDVDGATAQTAAEASRSTTTTVIG